MNRTAFYASLRSRASAVFGTSLSQGQVDMLNLMLDEGERRGLILTHLAYVMATPVHEVGSSLQPIRENLTYTSAARIRQVWPSRFKSDAIASAYVRQPQKLANLVYGGRLGIDLVNDPEAAMDADVAVKILFEGMIFGLFTGRKLSDYLNVRATDYYGARAIINGDVRVNGDRVAKYARDFEAALKAAGYSSQKAKPGPVFGPPPLGTPIPGTKPYEPPVASPAPPVADPKPKATPDQKLTLAQIIAAAFAWLFPGKK